MDLTVIDTAGHKLAPEAAASWARMRAAGLPGDNVTTAYRTAAEQSTLYAAYKAGTGNFALAPGKSEHEKGRAVDVSGALRTWMIAHSAAHGWKRTNPAEKWHFEYATSRDTHLADVTAPTPITPTTTLPLEAPMFTIDQIDRGTWLVRPDGTWAHLTPDEWANIKAALVDPGIIKHRQLGADAIGRRAFDVTKLAFTRKAD